MILNRNSKIRFDDSAHPLSSASPVQYAVSALRRDLEACFHKTTTSGGVVNLVYGHQEPQRYRLKACGGSLDLTAGDALGFVYGLFEISRRFLGVQPFWFWNDQVMNTQEQVVIPADFSYTAPEPRVRYRGWFINDEILIDRWSVGRDPIMPWIMAFEALLRCGGNLMIPGTDSNAHKYRALAADMGLAITHHHAEPLGARMFARAYPGLEPSFAKHPELFRGLWAQALEEQKELAVIWNIGFRGQGDRPFWLDDPQYDTPQKRGALMGTLIREQYDLIKAHDPGAVCCTNLYGETMMLYQQGCLELPEDVILIWADNGYGKMVSRRQDNDNPRVHALPRPGCGGHHGIYYHASFYDLQAASHITPLPNSPAFVRTELERALEAGAEELWLINCSNIKPHVYMLDLIARMWREGTVDTGAHLREYAEAYYGSSCAPDVAACMDAYWDCAIPYGTRADEHAGDQFYNHVPRILISQFMADRRSSAEALRWLCDEESLEKQAAWCAERYEAAQCSYSAYYDRCLETSLSLSGAARRLFEDSVLLHANLYRLWARGARLICRSLQEGFAGKYQRAFYLAGRAQALYAAADRAMREREHGKWVDFYANECQTDVKQTAYLCTYLMSFLRNLGDGPHFYEWQRRFQDSEADRRVTLLLNFTNHLTDAELFRLMEQQLGE